METPSLTTTLPGRSEREAGRRDSVGTVTASVAKATTSRPTVAPASCRVRGGLAARKGVRAMVVSDSSDRFEQG
jgi:hypothetical protein